MVSREDVMIALRNCYDPCCRDREISIVDMGLIEDIQIDGSHVRIDMLLTTGWCPFVANLNTMMINEVQRLHGVDDVNINVVWDPVWTMDRLSESARSKLTLPMEPLMAYREQRLAVERGE
jgi:metal-sulfur cluster biosynthetic enzyme